MGKLKILASGESPQAQSNSRGHLFEKLMAEVLRNLGYEIDKIYTTIFAGMEIDIEGTSIATSTKLYAECKYYEQEIDAPQVHSFFGKYFPLWRKDNHVQGLFIAIPGLNKTAKRFFEENGSNDHDITLKLKTEEDVIDLIIKSGIIIDPNSISAKFDSDIGNAGEWNILYTDKGIFILQYVISKGSGIPDSIAIFDFKGNIINDSSTLTYLRALNTEIFDLKLIRSVDITKEIEQVIDPSSDEQIVEVKGSSACFEYQFPASPEFFVGRDSVVKDINLYIDDVLAKRISARGILFEGNSGWGKSSAVLYSVDNIQNRGHFAVAIDSRSASSSQFMIRVVNYVLTKFRDFDELVEENREFHAISGFDGAVEEILKVGNELERKGKILVIFLDQFENVFYLPDALKRIRDLFLKINDAQTNIVLGFSWKTDLVGLTNDFPYKFRDEIKDSTKKIPIQRFSEIETNLLLERLESEIKRPLSKDLKFFLTDFSQGYPWLLKKLCAHVKSQIDDGITQREISTSLLNIKDLFQADISGLSAEEEDTLRKLAKVVPIGIQELGEDYRSEIVTSLVHARLLVRIGNKYDIYWDIFRDFLNTGNLPIQENYLLRSVPSSVIKPLKILNESGGKLPIQEFAEKSSLTQKTLLNVAKDTKLLGLASINQGIIELHVELPKQQTEFIDYLRKYIHERLVCNRLVKGIVDELEERNSLKMDDIAKILSELLPYISASKETWHLYGIILSSWMEFAEIAFFNRKKKVLCKLGPGVVVQKQDFVFIKHHRGMSNPVIQYIPIQDAAIRLFEAVKSRSKINWNGFSKIKKRKVLTSLEDLDFIELQGKALIVKPKLFEFGAHPERRTEIFFEAVSKIKCYQIFIDILKELHGQEFTNKQLSQLLRSRINPDWSDITAEWTTKILLNWVKYSQPHLLSSQ